MLAGWITLEARLAAALIVLLVFAAGMWPARRVQAAPPVVVATQQLPSRPSPQAGAKFARSDRTIMDTNPVPDEGAAVASPSAGDGVSADPTGELALVDQDRAQAGLPPLAASASLDRVATIRASQLVADGITHYRPGHSTLAAVELLQASHIPYAWHGENIIWEGSMPWAEVPAFFNNWWMASPAHRDNILNPHYRSVGVGIAKNGDAVYMVEVFSDQAGDPVETPSPPSPQGGGRR
jgi:uncharacterized protein YkwD